MQTQVTKKTFVDQEFFVGIDTHKKSWTVSILGEHYEHKTMSQNPDPEILARYLKKHFPGGKYHAVYEAGFSGFESCRELQQLGIDCIVGHAADIPSSQKEKLQKNDKADSRKLAKILRGKAIEAIHVPDRKLESDRALVRQRFKIVKDLSRIKNRVKSLLFQFGIQIPDRFTAAQTRHWSKVYINWLKELLIEHESLKQTLDNYIRLGEMQRKELLLINRQVRDLSQTNAYQKNFNLLISIPGIGLMVAMTLLVQIGDIRRFKSLDDLCNYLGLVPMMHSSGEKVVTGKMLKRGRKELKIMLIEASWVAIRKDPALMAKFNNLAKRMNKNKAIIRIAKSLLNRIRFVLTHQEKYELGTLN